MAAWKGACCIHLRTSHASKPRLAAQAVETVYRSICAMLAQQVPRSMTYMAAICAFPWIAAEHAHKWADSTVFCCIKGDQQKQALDVHWLVLQGQTSSCTWVPRPPLHVACRSLLCSDHFPPCSITSVIESVTAGSLCHLSLCDCHRCEVSSEVV